MSSETPTTEQVRAFVTDLDAFDPGFVPFTDAGEAFDRWLAEHNRQVSEKAWAQGHVAGWSDGWNHFIDDEEIPNPYAKEESDE